MFGFFSKTKKSDKIIERYINGIVNQEEFDYTSYSKEHKTSKLTLIRRLNNAVKDFMENADIHESNEDRNRKEFKVFANAHSLTMKRSHEIFAEILELVISNKIIISEYEYKQEKPKNLISN